MGGAAVGLGAASGIMIKVPQFVETGEIVRVDPTEGRYLERAK